MPEGDTVYALARRLDEALRDRVLTRGELRVPAHATAQRRRTWWCPACQPEPGVG